jgi:glycosyltransferase involved in cell wall biosynthesis
MSKVLNASLHELVHDAPAWRRYPVLLATTIHLIVKAKPSIIFAQNPSIVLAGLTVFLGKLLGIPVVIDAHNAGIFPLEATSEPLNRVAAFINNLAKIVIVSNDKLKDYVESRGGVAFVVPDPVPEISCSQIKWLSKDDFNIVYVCSWAEDEPYEEVIQMAADLKPSIKIHMTGNSKGRESRSGIELPENVILTGFLSNTDYDALLCSCDAVMVLTKREDCLVCGAYEAVAVGKPMILSDTTALKAFFYDGSVYADNTISGLQESIISLMQQYDKLSVDVRHYKISLQDTVTKQIGEMENSVLNEFES